MHCCKFWSGNRPDESLAPRMPSTPSAVRSSERLKLHGFLIKNHAGKPFSKHQESRFFVAEGFTVYYYVDESRKAVKGHFDLRNVLELEEATEMDHPGLGAMGGLVLHIWVDEAHQKKLILSFKMTMEDDKARWLHHCCSAVAHNLVAESLRPFADPEMRAALDDIYGASLAVAPVLNRLSKRPSMTKVLTPRSSSSEGAANQASAQAEAMASGTVELLDTPRGASSTFYPKHSASEVAPTPPAVSSHTAAVADSSGGGVLTFEMRVPRVGMPGARLRIVTPAGLTLYTIVPKHANAGSILFVDVPSVACAEDVSMDGATPSTLKDVTLAWV